MNELKVQLIQLILFKLIFTKCEHLEMPIFEVDLHFQLGRSIIILVIIPHLLQSDIVLLVSIRQSSWNTTYQVSTRRTFMIGPGERIVAIGDIVAVQPVPLIDDVLHSNLCHLVGQNQVYLYSITQDRKR